MIVIWSRDQKTALVSPASLMELLPAIISSAKPN